MKGREQLFSTGNGEHQTPRDLFRWAEWRFGKHTIDVAATAENALCRAYITQEMDAFKTDWRSYSVGWPVRLGEAKDRAWCNPPYGRGVGKWINRGIDQIDAGQIGAVTYLLPARTDTVWFHDAVVRRGWALMVYFLAGRVRFVGQKDDAPFPSMIMRWDVKQRGTAAQMVAVDWYEEFEALTRRVGG